MFCRIALLSAVCSLTILPRGSAEEKSTASPEVTILKDIPYREGASKRWRLDLAMKKDFSGKPRPGIVVIHGGGWVEGGKVSFSSRKYGVPGNIEDFAALGFVAVAINYRLSAEAPFPAALQDCKCAVRWLRSNAKKYHLDPEHIGAWGNSAGGHLAMLLGMIDKEAKLEGDGPYQNESSLVQAVVSDSGPIDLLYEHKQGTLRQVIEKFLGGAPEGRRIDLYKTASPCHQIGRNKPPLLLIYGGVDNQVHVETADQLVIALDRAGWKDVTYLRLEGVGHCPHSIARVSWLKPVVNEFFQRTLTSK
jgi:acetyl esterase/lipase